MRLGGILHMLLLSFTLLGVTGQASAQFSNSFEFLKAVREKDGATAQRALTATGGAIINVRDGDTGDAALHIAAKRSDAPWMGFLLQQGANPNLKDRSGNTPLIIVTNAGFNDGVQLLIALKADVNATNDSGETPLIKAVQVRRLDIVRTLLDAGARTDLTDNITGLTALEYAERDKRAGAIALLLRGKEK